MMTWSEVAFITFSCVAANHLGLVATAEGIIKRPLPIINCPKCFTFWSVLIYGLLTLCLSSPGFAVSIGFADALITTIAVSFLSSFLARWLHLLMAYTDHFYNKFYDTLFPTTNTPSDGAQHSDSPVPDMRQQ